MTLYDISALKDKLPEQSVLRAQKNTIQTIVLAGGSPVLNEHTVHNGVGAMVRQGEYVGFASAPVSSQAEVESLLQNAEANAHFMQGKSGRNGRAGTARKTICYQTPLEERRISQQHLMSFVQALDRRIAERYPGLGGRMISLRADSMEKHILTDDGTDAHILIPRCYLGISVSVQASDGQMVDYSQSIGGGGFFDEYFSDPALLDEATETVVAKAHEKAGGVYSRAGVCDVVLANSVTGILAHEAIGHTTEADMVISGSVAGPNLGHVVASPLISLTDFAFEAFGSRVPLPVFADDEGTAATDAVVIRDGVLTGYMNDLRSAERFHMQPTGNARAFLFSDEPLIRMRNTCIHPGTSRLEDMIAAVDDGYLLLKNGSGQADGTGEFMFGIQFGYEIKGGKLGRAIRDTTISGLAFEMLKAVDMVSDELDWSGAGNCGKKQMMPVSHGGPAIKTRLSIGGR